MNKHVRVKSSSLRDDLPAAIRIAAPAYRIIAATVGADPPETYAVIGGDPADRGRITEVRFLPAKRDASGKERASGAFVEPDMRYVNHILTKEWLRLGTSIFGYIHSHPGSMNWLSSGGAVAGSNVGDIPAMKAELRAARDAGLDYPFALMPILNFREGKAFDITGWIVTLEDDEPIAVPVIVEDETGEGNAGSAEEPKSETGTAIAREREAIAQLVTFLDIFQEPINRIERDRLSPSADKAVAMEAIRAVRAQALPDFMTSILVPEKPRD